MAAPNQIPSHMPSQLPSQMPVQAPTTPPGQTIQLHDIHPPEQISNFPIAPGWWILLALLLLAAFLVYKQFKRTKQLNLIKKQALASLDNNPLMNAKECISLLKWAAMQSFSRVQLAKLFGNKFQLFLIAQLPEKHQTNFKALSDAGFTEQYQNNEVGEQVNSTDSDCYQAAKLWLNHALPVNSNKVNEETKEISE